MLTGADLIEKAFGAPPSGGAAGGDDASLPRGLRNNNPLNIRHGSVRWDGMAADQPDPGFVRFETPEAGWQAADRLLETYGRKHGINTLYGAIQRWAPASDGNNPVAYAKRVSAETGFDPLAPIDLSDPGVRAPILKAMAAVENGRAVEMPGLMQSASASPKDDWALSLIRERTAALKAAPQAVQAPQEEPGFWSQFGSSLVGDNARLAGAALRGHGLIMGNETMTDLGRRVEEWGKGYRGDNRARVSSFTEISPPGMSIDEIKKSMADAYSYARGAMAQGMASTVPSIAGGAAGFAAGGPFGALAGAAAPAYWMNYADALNGLEEELKPKVERGEMTPQQVAKWAAPVGLAMSALDVGSLAKFAGNLAPAEIKRGVVRAVAKAIGEGALIEGSTEGLQEVIKQGAQAALSGNPALTKERAIAVIDNALGGMLTGGPMGGGTHLAGRMRASPQSTETSTTEATGDAASAVQEPSAPDAPAASISPQEQSIVQDQPAAPVQGEAAAAPTAPPGTVSAGGTDGAPAPDGVTTPERLIAMAFGPDAAESPAPARPAAVQAALPVTQAPGAPFPIAAQGAAQRAPATTNSQGSATPATQQTIQAPAETPIPTIPEAPVAPPGAVPSAPEPVRAVPPPLPAGAASTASEAGASALPSRAEQRQVTGAARVPMKPRRISESGHPDILDWIARNGGIVDRDGDLKAMDLHLWHRGKAFRPRLLRSDAVAREQGDIVGNVDRAWIEYTPDRWRERAIELGWLPDGATVNDLYNEMERAARGVGKGDPAYANDPPSAAEIRRAHEENEAAIQDRMDKARAIAAEYGIRFTPAEIRAIAEDWSDGAPMEDVVFAHAEREHAGDLYAAEDATTGEAYSPPFDEAPDAAEAQPRSDDPGRRAAASEPESATGEPPTFGSLDREPAGRAADARGLPGEAGGPKFAARRPGVAGRGVTERTDQGDNFVLPGLAVTNQDRLDAARRAPMRGGNKPLDDGLFDTGARRQTDIVDLAGGGGKPRASLRAPETAATRANAPLRSALVDRLRTLGLDDKIGLRLLDKIEATIGGKASAADGMYANRIISLALDNPGGSEGIARTLDHEAIHALRDLGLFTDQEWRALVRAALADPARAASIQERYAGLTPEARAEEAVAAAFAAWADGRQQPPGFAQRMWRRVVDFIEAIRNAFTGNGFRSAADVFGAVERGEVGRRVDENLSVAYPNYMVRAWHGSPHEFDRFSTEKIGTGEGAQAYGWGLYFASKKEIAEHYRETLGETIAVAVGYATPPLGTQTHTAFRHIGQMMELGVSAETAKRETIQRMRAQADRYAEADPPGANPSVPVRELRAAANVIERIPADRFAVQKGRLYQANLNVDDDQLLDWDKPISEQPEKVREALATLGIEAPKKPSLALIADPLVRSIVRRALSMSDGDINQIGLTIDNDAALWRAAKQYVSANKIDLLSDISPGDYIAGLARPYTEAAARHEAADGRGAYVTLASKLAAHGDERPNWTSVVNTFNDKVQNHRAASLALAQAGIPGLRYLDGSSRADGDGSHNYVIFDDSLVDIGGKFSVRDPMAAGGRLAAEGAAIGPAMAGARYAARGMSAVDIAKQAIADLAATRKRRLPETVDPNWLARKFLHPRMLAQMNRAFAPVYLAAQRMIERRDATASILREKASVYFKDLTQAERATVNKALERGRLEGEVGGDIVAGLTKKEMDAYSGVRAAMDASLDLMRDAYLDNFGIARGTSIEQLKQMATEDKRLGALVERLEELDQAKRKGYVPFTRYGQWGITVRDGAGNLVAFEKLEPSGIPLAGRKLTDQRAERRREELMREYPASKGYKVGQWFETASEAALKGQGVSLAQIDMLASLGGSDLAAYPELREALEKGLKVGGFKKHFLQSSNVAGYSKDFERSIADYIIGLSGYLARQEAKPQFDSALAGLGLTTDPATGERRTVTRQPELLKYAMDYIDYVQSPAEEFQAARAITFFYYLAGNISSALTNMSQVGMVTAPYLSQFASVGRVGRELKRAYGDVLRMVSPGRKGVEVFDLDRAPEDVRDALRRAVEDGDLVAQATYDMMATATGRNEFVRGLKGRARTVADAIASTFTVAERVNRMVTFIAAYRMAQDKAVMTKAGDVLARDALFTAQRQAGSVVAPETFARHIVDETQFRMGKVNRPEALRKFGAWFFQFKGFAMQSLELYWRLLSRNGADGRVAFGFMMLGLLMTAGLFGTPFADDMKSLFEFGYRKLTGYDVDVEKEMRLFLAQMTGSPRIAEAVTRGPARLLGVDLSKRLGMGDNIPNSAKDAGGIPLEMTIGRLDRAWKQASEGALIQAGAELAPAFIRNPAIAAGWAAEGIRGQNSGRVTIPAEKVTAGDIIAKALGFTSSNITRERERFEMERRVGEASKDIQGAFYTRFSKALADIQRARIAGDEAAAQSAARRLTELRTEIIRLNQNAAPEDRIILNPSHIQNLVRVEMMGRDANRPARKARPEVTRIREAMTF